MKAHTLNQNRPVVVFGSLRRGYGNDRLWRGLPGVTWLGDVDITDVRLYMEHAGFPFATAETGAVAAGEMLVADDDTWPEFIRRLDQLEGEGRFYHRRITTAEVVETALSYETWVYLNSAEMVEGMRPVPGNDWANVDRYQGVGR